MPLTAKQKNQIAQGLDVVAGPAKDLFIAAVTPVPRDRSDVERALRAVFGLGGTFGLFNKSRRPKTAPFAGTFGAVAELNRQGREGVLGTDPFRRAVVVSARDQDPFLFELVEAAAIRRAVSEFGASGGFKPFFTRRQDLISGLAETAFERGFSREIDQSLRGGVFRPDEDAPLQFLEGDFLP